MEPMKVYVEISETISGTIEFRELPFVKKDLVKGLDGSSYSRKLDTFTVPLTWQSCLALRSTFGSDLVIGPELLKWATDLRKTQIDPAMYWRGVLEGPCETELDEMLFAHQRADVRFVAATGAALICNGLGSGKTFSALASLRHLHEQGEEVFPVLVACPNSVKNQWVREISRVWPDASAHVVAGTLTQKRKVIKEFQESGAEFLIINWEAISDLSSLKHYGSTALTVCVECGGLDPSVKTTKCERHRKELNEINFTSIIGDELHRIKSPSAKQTRAFKRVSEQSTYRIGLTGTPIANTPKDLWSLLNWLLPDSYTSSVKFQDHFLNTTYDQWGYSQITGLNPSTEAEFFAGLDPYMRRMPTEAILPFLPPVIRETRYVDLPPTTKQGKAYKQMLEESIAELDNNTFVTASSAMTITARLMQFAAAYGEVEVTPYMAVNEDGEEYEAVKQTVTLTEPSVTLDAFMDDLDGFGDEQVVVFAPSKGLINLLTARLTKAGKKWGRVTGDAGDDEREFHLKNFQEGRTQFMCCTTGAGGTGLNLQNARTAVYLYRPYSAIESLQSEGRIRRIGSEKFDHVQYIDYVVRGTVQESVLNILNGKEETLETILRDKELLKRLFLGEEIDVPGKLEDSGCG